MCSFSRSIYSFISCTTSISIYTSCLELSLYSEYSLNRNLKMSFFLFGRSTEDIILFIYLNRQNKDYEFPFYHTKDDIVPIEILFFLYK